MGNKRGKVLEMYLLGLNISIKQSSGFQLMAFFFWAQLQGFNLFVSFYNHLIYMNQLISTYQDNFLVLIHQMTN